MSASQDVRRILAGAFKEAEAVRDQKLTVHGPRHDADLGELLALLHVEREWPSLAAEAEHNFAQAMDAAEQRVARLRREVAEMRAVAAFLADGTALPATVHSATALAARMLAGSPDGLQAAESLRPEIARAEKLARELAGEVARARSAGKVLLTGAAAGCAVALGAQEAPALLEAHRVAREQHREARAAA